MKKIFTIILILTATYFNSNAQGLVINEVDYDMAGTDTSEFIELYNSGSSAIDLGIYRVILYNGNSATAGVYDSFPLPAQMLNPGSYFVICGSSGTVPNCNMTRSIASNMIQNGSPDAIALMDTSSGFIVDALSYEGNCPPPYIEGNGVPLAQSDTGSASYVGMGRFPDGTDTNDDSTDFHRACITPGGANVNTTTACGPLGVKLIVPRSHPSVYPNPSNGLVNVDITGSQLKNSSIVVSDLLGNEIRKATFKNNSTVSQVDLSEFQDGIYFVKIKSDSGETTQRVILKK